MNENLEKKPLEEILILEKLLLGNKTSENIGGEIDFNITDQEKVRILNLLKESLRKSENVSQLTSIKDIRNDKKIIGSFIVFIKRSIRKLTKWYVEPICTQQNEVNQEILQFERENYVLFKHLIRDVEAEKQRIDTIEKSIVEFEENKNRITVLNHQIDLLKSSFINLNDNPSGKENCIIENEDNFWLNRQAYAQSGEDIIIEYVLMVLGIPLDKCNYLDLGANHARELSNTYSLYNKGARGVLVEANPALIPELNLYCSENTIINKCISNVSGEKVKFYILNGDGLSSMDKNAIDSALTLNSNLKLEKIIEVETITIQEIIKKYFTEAPVVLNIDIEGADMDILESINWDKTRPLLVVLEMIEYSPKLLVNDKKENVKQFMEHQGYAEYAFTGINSIFIDKERVNLLNE